MNPRRFWFAIGAAVILVAGAWQARATAQSPTEDVILTVTASGGQPIRFRGAVMFPEGGLQIIDGQTPFETRGRGGIVLGMFERIGVGPDIQVALSNGQSSASGTAARVIVGNRVFRGIDIFAKTF
jgi:hypothetical protein